MSLLASILEMLSGLTLLWLMHVVPIAIVLTVGWLIKKKQPIAWLEMGLMAIGPFVFWCILMSFWGAGKSLSNLVECIYLAPIIALIMAIRLPLGDRKSLIPFVISLHVAAFVTAFLLWLLVPGLPE